MNVVEEDTDTSDSYSFTTTSSQQEEDNFDSKNECKNQNFMTFDDYTNDDPGLFSIKVFDLKHQSFGTGTCITKEEIKQWTANENNIMSLYSKPPKEFFNDVSGKGTEPLNKKVFLLPNNNIYVTWKSIDKLMNETKFPAKYYAVPLFEGKRRRIGNMDRNFGVSRNHGQLDGSIIYKLYSKSELKNITTIKEDDDEFYSLKIPTLEEVFQRLDEIYTIKDDQAFLSALGTEFYYYPNEPGSIYDIEDHKVPYQFPLKKKYKKEMIKVYKDYLSEDEINLDFHQLRSLPSLFKAVKISVDLNSISRLGEYPNVRYFSCSNNRLQLLPNRLPKIESLFCVNNILTHIPSYSTITRLECDGNHISELPEMLNITELSCIYNVISPTLPNMPNLKTLKCAQNKIEYLPPFPKLKTLICNNNRIIKLPEKMPMILNIECYHNPIQKIVDIKRLYPNLNSLVCDKNVEIEANVVQYVELMDD